MDVPVTLERMNPRAASGVQLLKAYVVSDVHLNDHPYEHTHEIFDEPFEAFENPRRKHFREFLTRINNEAEEQGDHKILLVLNGDILDITGSWFDTTLPWDHDLQKVEAITLEVIRRIVENNQSVIRELNRLVGQNKGEIVFVVGNHDGMFNRFPQAQELVRHSIAPDGVGYNQIRFVNALDCPDLSLYAEHGNQFDPFNRFDANFNHPLGDYINILLVNRFVELVMSQLHADGYSTALIGRLRLRLHDIEYLRPFSLIPLWIENVAKEYRRHPENEGKRQTIDSIILSGIAEVLDTKATRRIAEQLKLPMKFLTSVVNWGVHLPGTLPIVSFLISHTMRRTHNNRYQYKMAHQLHYEKGYRLITFGHTHVPSVIPLSQDGYFFNTGSWKPVVNLFKELEHDETNLEYLIPHVRFNKIERSGILVIEKHLDKPAEAAKFSLQTNESNHSDGHESPAYAM